jgi:hypothetical protein
MVNEMEIEQKDSLCDYKSELTIGGNKTVER